MRTEKSFLKFCQNYNVDLHTVELFFLYLLSLEDGESLLLPTHKLCITKKDDTHCLFELVCDEEIHNLIIDRLFPLEYQ